jgi:hypothetical protein
VSPHGEFENEASEESTVVPVFLTSDLPPLRRVPKDSQSGGPPPNFESVVSKPNLLVIYALRTFIDLGKQWTGLVHGLQTWTSPEAT